MKTTRILTLICTALFLISCNSAKKAEAERKRQQQKMEELDQQKRQFEQKNP
ncbi:MAG: hypothetical protein WC760_11860 [Bacteroidia bacterium]